MGSTPSFSPTKVLARTISRVVTPINLFGSYTPKDKDKDKDKDTDKDKDKDKDIDDDKAKDKDRQR